MASHTPVVPARTRQANAKITIDFLFLDLTTCARCVGTDRSLEVALGIVRDVLDATGAIVEVRKTLVETAEQARELQFVSSPTIRLNGRDIALELQETPCDSEVCGCDGEQIACRVWAYRGQDYTEAPVGLILDAILGGLYSGVTLPERERPEPHELPANLEAFFAARVQGTPEPSACCGPAEQASCCEPSAKADCCGEMTSGECGCR